jgi:hypothetical protein
MPPFTKEPTTGTITENSIQILWNFSDAVDMIGGRYEVTRNNFTTFETYNHTENTTYSHTFTGLTSGQNYVFKLRAIDDDNTVGNVQQVIAGTIIDPPATPQGLTLLPGDNQIILNWNDSTEDDVDGYKIYVDGVFLISVNDSNYTHSGLINDNEKCYQVLAFDTNDNESNKTSSMCGTPTDSTPPFDISVITTIDSSEYNYTFGWDKEPPEDTAYFIIYKNNIPVYNVPFVNGQTSYSYTATNLIPGTLYTFKVNPVDDDGNEQLYGSNSSIQLSTFSTAPAPPTGLTSTSGDGSVTLNWNEHPETDVKQYKIFVNGTLLTTVNNDTFTYTHNTMNPNAKNYYITAVDLGNAESNASNIVTASPVILNPPTLPFVGETSPITGDDVVASTFSLMNVLKWFILLSLAAWFAWKMIQSMKFSLNRGRSQQTVDDTGNKIISKKLEEQEQQQKQIERMKERMNKKR